VVVTFELQTCRTFKFASIVMDTKRESSDTEVLLASQQQSTPTRTYARSRSRTITSRTPQKAMIVTPTKLLMEAVSDLYVPLDARSVSFLAFPSLLRTSNSFAIPFSIGNAEN